MRGKIIPSFKKFIKNKTYMQNLILWTMATLFIVFLKGYRFIDSDQTVYLLNPMRLANQNFIPNDWFTWQTSHYHITYTYITLALLKIGNFQIGAFIGYLLGSLIFAISLWILVDTIIPKSKDKNLIFIIGLIVLMAMQSKSIGATFFKTNLFSAQDMAWPFLILSTAYLIKNKYLFSGVMLGLAGLFHFNFLVVGLAVAFIFFLLQSREMSMKSLATRFGILSLAACVIASPVIYIAISQFLDVGKSDKALFEVFFNRSAHHFLPGAWPLSQVLKYLFYNLAGILCLGYIVTKEQIANYKNLLKYFFSVSILIVLAIVFVEFYPVLFVKRLFLWRIAPILTILSTVFITIFLVSSWLSNEILKKLLAVMLIAILWLEIGNAIILILFLLLTALLFTIGFKESESKIRLAPIFVSAIALLFLLVSPSGFIRQPIKLEPWLKKPVKQLYEFIGKETPKNSVFLVPPMDGNLQSFRIIARRAIFVNYKAVPYKFSEVKEWKRRMDLLGYKEYDYYRLRPDKIAEVSRKNGIEYFVTNKKFVNKNIDFKKTGMKIIFTKPNNPYVVYRIVRGKD